MGIRRPYASGAFGGRDRESLHAVINSQGKVSIACAEMPGVAIR
jgi:hypothetical protein